MQTSAQRNASASQCVLITGGPDGFGLELVRHYHGIAFQVITTGRRAIDQLPDEIPEGVIYVQANQTDLANVNAILDAVDGHAGGRLDIAILNAGTGFTTKDLAENDDELNATLVANLDFTIALSHGLYSRLYGVEDGAAHMGKLALIGSVAYKGADNFPTYAATKAGLHGLARALREEWRGRIDVKIIHPGPTRTSMHEKANLDVSNINWAFLKPEWMAKNIVATIDGGRSQVRLSHGSWMVSKTMSPVKFLRKSSS